VVINAIKMVRKAVEVVCSERLLTVLDKRADTGGGEWWVKVDEVVSPKVTKGGSEVTREELGLFEQLCGGLEVTRPRVLPLVRPEGNVEFPLHVRTVDTVETIPIEVHKECGAFNSIASGCHFPPNFVVGGGISGDGIKRFGDR